MLSIRDTKKEDSSEDELRNELMKLKRQYRYLSDDRKAYRNETEHILKKQNRVIAGLLQEENDMLKDMNLVKLATNKVADKKNLEKIHALLDEEKMTKIAIEEETNQMIDDLNAMKNQQQKIEQMAKNMVGGRYDQDRRIRAEKKCIRTMENRLNQATIRFSEILARNTSHRQNIEYIAVQRTRFLDLKKKLEKVFRQGKNERDKLIDLSKALYTTREEADHRMKYLTDKSERDLASFNSELKDLVRIIDHDKKLREFMTTKENDLSIMYEKAVQERKEKKAANNVKMLQKEVEQYDEIFKRLIEVSGDADVNEMVKRFIGTEDINFALFNYVNEQNMHCKQLQLDIERLKKESSSMSNYCGSMTTERKKIYKEVEETFQNVSQEKKEINQSYKNAKKIIEQAKEMIWALFNKMKNKPASVQNILGNSEITEENMMQFLGEIERNANELLQMKLLVAVKDNNQHEIVQLQAARTEQQIKGQKSTFMPPSVIIDNLDSANYTRVAHKSQLNDQTLKPLQEEEAFSTATRSLSRLALQQHL